MRLFLVAVGMGALLSGCTRGDDAGAGAVRVEIFYATFRPGCLTLTVVDAADASHVETQQLPVEERHSDARTVAVFRKADWSRNLRVTASAREGSCTGLEVATSTREIEIPEKGATGMSLDLRAEDLDGDGYVSARAPWRGSDCDDTDATVYPGAPETCDGKDSNCTGGEDDAVNPRGYYVDTDADGYGDATRVVRACTPPEGAVAAAGDCRDMDPAVHPGQTEPRCDGEDDDCDGTADDDFLLGTACETELGCAGSRVCAADQSGAVCSSTQSPGTWYADADGDGRFGTLVTLSCKAPAGARSVQDDCDDTSRFIGGPEVCDRLDNDCGGTVDEGGVCAGVQWTARTGLGAGAAWEAVATYGTGKAWLAGAGGQLAHVSGATVTSVAGCAGDWKAAWARPSDGRVFLGSAQGLLATTPVVGAACATASVSGVTSSINGLVGFEREGLTTVYAVTSGGHVLRWDWRDAPATPPAPVVSDRLPANLKDVHGQDAGTLLAVGAEDFQVDGGALPRAYRFDVASGKWARESLPPDTGAGSLRSVFVADAGRAYAVGDKGLVLERQAGAWRKLPPPDGAAAPDLLGVAAFHPTALLVLSNKSGVYLHLYDGGTWTEPSSQASPLLSLDALGPREQWAAGLDGTLLHWGP